MPNTRNHLARQGKSEIVCCMSKSRDVVEIHFNAPQTLAERFKKALAESEWSTQSEYFRFQMKQLVEAQQTRPSEAL